MCKEGDFMTLHKNLKGTDLHGSKVDFGTGTPIGVRLPTVIGELYFDIINKSLYIAIGKKSEDWTLVSTEAILSHTHSNKQVLDKISVELLNSLEQKTNVYFSEPDLNDLNTGDIYIRDENF